MVTRAGFTVHSYTRLQLHKITVTQDYSYTRLHVVTKDYNEVHSETSLTDQLSYMAGGCLVIHYPKDSAIPIVPGFILGGAWVEGVLAPLDRIWKREP